MSHWVREPNVSPFIILARRDVNCRFGFSSLVVIVKDGLRDMRGEARLASYRLASPPQVENAA